MSECIDLASQRAHFRAMKYAKVRRLLQEQIDLNAELLEALKEVEWSFHGCCPQCGKNPKQGHQPKCVLHNAIAKAEGATNRKGEQR